MNKKSSLTQTDWILAAFRALTREGPQGIRVEAIARNLKVSKGSFYWHFKDVPALKLAMLAHWSQAGTEDVISTITTTHQGPRAQLYALFDTSVDYDSRDVGGVLAEAAIRDWARYFEPAEAVLRRVDLARLKFVSDLFVELGNSPELAEKNARLLYASLIGMAHLVHEGLANMEHDIKGLLELLLKDAV